LTSDIFTGDKAKYKTDPVFLIGNGKSRQNFSLERLRKIGTIIGCNAIYRDFNPDILVSIDAKMLRELSAAKYGEQEKHALIVSPHNRSVGIVNSVKYKTGRFNTSGAFAMRMIMESMKPKRCYMLGMDGFPGNVYDGTKNYAVHSLKNFNGIHRFYQEILNQSTETTFINVNTQDGWPATCENSGHYSFMTYDIFEKVVMKEYLIDYKENFKAE